MTTKEEELHENNNSQQQQSSRWKTIALHLPRIAGEHNNKMQENMAPKGCVAVKVGPEGEEQKRFVVPLVHLHHPLFGALLEEAEEEYGFDHKGAITIPCRVERFRQVEGIIDREIGGSHHHHHHHYHEHHEKHHGHHYLPHFAGCFKA